MKNYIIRIYQCKENKSRNLVGIVEDVGIREKKSFTSYSELWNILKTGEGQLMYKKAKKTDK